MLFWTVSSIYCNGNFGSRDDLLFKRSRALDVVGLTCIGTVVWWNGLKLGWGGKAEDVGALVDW